MSRENTEDAIVAEFPYEKEEPTFMAIKELRENLKKHDRRRLKRIWRKLKEHLRETSH